MYFIVVLFILIGLVNRPDYCIRFLAVIIVVCY